MDIATRNPGGGEIGRSVPAGPIDSPARTIKEVLDSLLAWLILVGTSPFLLLALIVVRLTSSGPVIYTQKRLGRGGCGFVIYKVRTMYVNSEPAGPCWSKPGDPRVTPVGRLLRLSHIDELPQLINVLRGEMSLMGPDRRGRDRGRPGAGPSRLPEATRDASRTDGAGPGPPGT